MTLGGVIRVVLAWLTSGAILLSAHAQTDDLLRAAILPVYSEAITAAEDRELASPALCQALTDFLQGLAPAIPDLEWVERASIDQVVEEIAGQGGRIDALDGLAVGRWLKADLLWRTRLEEAGTNQWLCVDAIDAARADLLGATRVELKEGLPSRIYVGGTNDPIVMWFTDTSKKYSLSFDRIRIDVLEASLGAMVTNAIASLRQREASRTIVPLYFSNLTPRTSRLDYIGTDLRRRLLAFNARPDEGVFCFSFEAASEAAEEFLLAASGLTETDAARVRGLGDLYVWGSYYETNAAGLAFGDVPVVMTMWSWDTVSAPVPQCVTTTVSRLPLASAHIVDNWIRNLREVGSDTLRVQHADMLIEQLRAEARRLEHAIGFPHQGHMAVMDDSQAGLERRNLACRLLGVAHFLNPVQPIDERDLLALKDRSDPATRRRWLRHIDRYGFDFVLPTWGEGRGHSAELFEGAWEKQTGVAIWMTCRDPFASAELMAFLQRVADAPDKARLATWVLPYAGDILRDLSPAERVGTFEILAPLIKAMPRDYGTSRWDRGVNWGGLQTIYHDSCQTAGLPERMQISSAPPWPEYVPRRSTGLDDGSQLSVPYPDFSFHPPDLAVKPEAVATGVLNQPDGNRRDCLSLVPWQDRLLLSIGEAGGRARMRSEAGRYDSQTRQWEDLGSVLGSHRAIASFVPDGRHVWVLFQDQPPVRMDDGDHVQRFDNEAGFPTAAFHAGARAGAHVFLGGCSRGGHFGYIDEATGQWQDVTTPVPLDGITLMASSGPWVLVCGWQLPDPTRDLDRRQFLLLFDARNHAWQDAGVLAFVPAPATAAATTGVISSSASEIRCMAGDTGGFWIGARAGLVRFEFAGDASPRVKRWFYPPTSRSGMLNYGRRLAWRDSLSGVGDAAATRHPLARTRLIGQITALASDSERVYVATHRDALLMADSRKMPVRVRVFVMDIASGRWLGCVPLPLNLCQNGITTMGVDAEHLWLGTTGWEMSVLAVDKRAITHVPPGAWVSDEISQWEIATAIAAASSQARGIWHLVGGDNAAAVEALGADPVEMTNFVEIALLAQAHERQSHTNQFRALVERMQVLDPGAYQAFRGAYWNQ